MNPFDPNVFPSEPGESAMDYLERFERSAEQEVGDLQRAMMNGFAHSTAAEQGEELEDDDEQPFLLEFALSRDGEIEAHAAIVAVRPDSIPFWAWQAFLEGVVISARGRAAMTVSEEALRLEGLIVDEDEAWDEVDEVEHGMNLDPHDPLYDEDDDEVREDLPF